VCILRACTFRFPAYNRQVDDQCDKLAIMHVGACVAVQSRLSNLFFVTSKANLLASMSVGGGQQLVSGCSEPCQSSTGTIPHCKDVPWHDAVVFNRLQIGHTRLTHLHLLTGEDLPTCQFCSLPFTVNHLSNVPT